MRPPDREKPGSGARGHLQRDHIQPCVSRNVKVSGSNIGAEIGYPDSLFVVAGLLLQTGQKWSFPLLSYLSLIILSLNDIYS